VINNLIGLIPARYNSIRIKNKNFREFCGLPLLLHTVLHSAQANIFGKVIISTDNPSLIKERLNSIKHAMGINCKIHDRRDEFSHNRSTDCEWIYDALCATGIDSYDHFMILRPTNPFRTFGTITRSWDVYKKVNEESDEQVSLKSVSVAKNRYEKMWTYLNNTHMRPLHFTYHNSGKPGWELPHTLLPTTYAQNGCIDICPVSIIKNKPNTYIGQKIIPFFTTPLESLDLNEPLDWEIAELLYAKICRQKNSYSTVIAENTFFHVQEINKILKN